MTAWNIINDWATSDKYSSHGDSRSCTAMELNYDNQLPNNKAHKYKKEVFVGFWAHGKYQVIIFHTIAMWGWLFISKTTWWC